MFETKQTTITDIPASILVKLKVVTGARVRPLSFICLTTIVKSWFGPTTTDPNNNVQRFVLRSIIDHNEQLRATFEFIFYYQKRNGQVPSSYSFLEHQLPILYTLTGKGNHTLISSAIRTTIYTAKNYPKCIGLPCFNHPGRDYCLSYQAAPSALQLVRVVQSGQFTKFPTTLQRELLLDWIQHVNLGYEEARIRSKRTGIIKYFECKEYAAISSMTVFAAYMCNLTYGYLHMAETLVGSMDLFYKQVYEISNSLPLNIKGTSSCGCIYVKSLDATSSCETRTDDGIRCRVCHDCRSIYRKSRKTVHVRVTPAVQIIANMVSKLDELYFAFKVRAKRNKETDWVNDMLAFIDIFTTAVLRHEDWHEENDLRKAYSPDYYQEDCKCHTLKEDVICECKDTTTDIPSKRHKHE